MSFILKINDLFSFLHIDHLIVHSMLICLIEEWRQKVGNDHFVGAVLMDLSKTFDCISYDLLIAKLSAYGLSNEDLDYILLYPSGQKQYVKISNCYSIFQLNIGSFAGVNFGTNIFINDLIIFIKQTNLHNYADDNTITFILRSLLYLKTTLESDETVNWLKQSNMVVNSKNCQVLFLARKKELIMSDMSLNINSNNICCPQTGLNYFEQKLSAD